MLLSTVGVGSPINITNTQFSWLMKTPLLLLVVATTTLSFLLRIPTTSERQNRNLAELILTADQMNLHLLQCIT